MTDWTSRCESGNCLQTRRVHLADEYVELRDTEMEGTLLVTVAAWQAHEAALRAEGRRLAADEIRASAASIILCAEAEAGVDGAADHPFLLGCEWAALLIEVRDEPEPVVVDPSTLAIEDLTDEEKAAFLAVADSPLLGHYGPLTAARDDTKETTDAG